MTSLSVSDLKRWPAGQQPLAQLDIILDNAVMDDGEPPAAIAVGVGVVVRDGAGGGPARVPDGQARLAQRRGRATSFPMSLAVWTWPAVVHRDAPRIIAAIFQFLQAIKNQARRLAVRTGIAEDATHE